MLGVSCPPGTTPEVVMNTPTHSILTSFLISFAALTVSSSLPAACPKPIYRIIFAPEPGQTAEGYDINNRHSVVGLIRGAQNERGFMQELKFFATIQHP